MKTVGRWTVNVVVVAATFYLTTVGLRYAFAEDGVRALRYKEVGGDGPTLVVKGAGALQAEDSAELVLVDYSGERIVYKVVVP